MNEWMSAYKDAIAKMDKREALEIVKRKWHDEGACDSCNWHPMLSEHGWDDDSLMDAFDIAINGADMYVAEFSCLNPEDDGAWCHRGSRIWLKPAHFKEKPND